MCVLANYSGNLTIFYKKRTKNFQRLQIRELIHYCQSPLSTQTDAADIYSSSLGVSIKETGQTLRKRIMLHYFSHNNTFYTPVLGKISFAAQLGWARPVPFGFGPGAARLVQTCRYVQSSKNSHKHKTVWVIDHPLSLDPHLSKTYFSLSIYVILNLYIYTHLKLRRFLKMYPFCQ